MHDGDELAFGGSNLEIAPLEVDGVVVIDASRGAQRKVEIQERGRRAWAHGGVGRQLGVCEDLKGDISGGAVDFAILAADFELKDLVSLLPSRDVGVGQEGHETFLEGSKAALDLALGLRSGGDQVSDAESQEGPLEVAFGVGPVVSGTWSKEAQSVGIDDFGNAVGFEGFAKVEEVIPGGVGGDETPGHVEAGMVIDGEQEGLLARGGPPLVDRTVVLPEFADFGAAKASIDAILWWWFWNEVSEMGFHVGLDSGTGAGESAETLKFIADKLVVGRVLHGQEASEEGVNFVWPETVAVTSAGPWAVGVATSQPGSPHAIELRSAYTQLRGRSRGVQESRVKFIKSLEDELAGKPVNDLLLFKSTDSTAQTNNRDQSSETFSPSSDRPSRHRRPALRRPALRSGLLQASLRWRRVPFCSVSVPFCSGPDSLKEISLAIPGAATLPTTSRRVGTSGTLGRS